MPSAGELAVGHAAMDAEHQAILAIAAEVQAAVDRSDAAATAGALARLWEAVVGHFAGEEALMEQHAYPERRAHAGAHLLFLADLKALLDEVREHGLSEEVVSWARQRTPEWIAFHIETNDAPLARFLARRTAERVVDALKGVKSPPRSRGA